MANEFKNGEVVQLKSGGPNMVVDHTGPTVPNGTKLRVWCEWFDGKKKVRDNFAPDSPRVVPEKEWTGF